MGFKNSALNLLFNPIGIFEETFKVGGAAPEKNEPAAPTPLPMPQAPDTSAISEQATKTAQRKRAGLTETIYTSPLGVSGQARVASKTLLGQ